MAAMASQQVPVYHQPTHLSTSVSDPSGGLGVASKGQREILETRAAGFFFLVNFSDFVNSFIYRVHCFIIARFLLEQIRLIPSNTFSDILMQLWLLGDVGIGWILAAEREMVKDESLDQPQKFSQNAQDFKSSARR